jgi:hypothetical protein
MDRKLQTVAKFAAGSPFTESQIRWWLFGRAHNGLDGARAVVSIGRRVYIDVDGFDRWITAQNAKAAA